MKFHYIFIITYGRSGSTLLTHVLNSSDQCKITGENFNLVFHAYRMIRASKLFEGTRSFGVGTPFVFAEKMVSNEFEEMIVDNIRSKVLFENDENCIYGFKEVRFGPDIMDDSEFVDYLDFLRKKFEKSCFIFNVRSHDKVAKSYWWKHYSGVNGFLSKVEDRMLSYYSANREVSYWWKYEYFESKDVELPKLFDFVGIELHWEAVNRALSIRYAQPAKLDLPFGITSVKSVPHY